jgi:hypothetical protein
VGGTALPWTRALRPASSDSTVSSFASLYGAGDEDRDDMFAIFLPTFYGFLFLTPPPRRVTRIAAQANLALGRYQ